MGNTGKIIEPENNVGNIIYNLSARSKLLILGTVLSSVLIVFTAWLVIESIQKTIFQNYYNFGVVLSKTLSVEGYDLILNSQNSDTYQNVKNRAEMVLESNKDIAYIIFKDNKKKVLFTITSKNYSPENITEKIEVSSPIVYETAGIKQVIGSIQLGLSGETMNDIRKTARNFMLGIFTFAWLLSITAVLINTSLITRQLKLLSDGVKRLSSGQFGLTLDSKDLWGEIKQLFDTFNEMSVRLRSYEEKNIDQLTYERNKLEAVLMCIANGVVVCDKRDKIILVNNAALKLLEAKSEEILNSQIQDYCDTNGEMCFADEIKKFKDVPLEEFEIKPFEFNLKLNQKVGLVLISPIFSLNREYLGYIIIIHDITKEDEIDKLKSSFISNVSHELRTPVTVIRSYIDTLHNFSSEFDDKTKEEFISVMYQEADRLNKLVNDILDFSRLESPNVELEKCMCDIGPIIDITLKSMKVLAEEKGLSFSSMVEPDIPKVNINAESIERVLKNLLSNAIKYSDESGRIKVKAEIDRTGNYLQVSVEDNGIGIPEEHLGRIFDRFYRVETKTHTIKGTGLGLHLTKITIEKHHKGQVFVQSKVGEGSTFGFRIPLIAETAEV